MPILGVFTQIVGVRSPSEEPIIGVPTQRCYADKKKELLQRDELKKFDEDGEKDEDNHDGNKEDDEDDVNDEDDDNSYDLWEDDYLGQCWPAGPWAVRGGIGIFWAALDPDPHIMTFCLQET